MHRFMMLSIVAALMASPASAQDEAKARLEKSPRHQEYVKVKQGGREVECFLVYPEVKDKAPVVVLIHEIFGSPIGFAAWLTSLRKPGTSPSRPTSSRVQGPEAAAPVPIPVVTPSPGL